VAAAGREGERWLADEPATDYDCAEPTVDLVASVRGEY
jgi:hypothetical protein